NRQRTDRLSRSRFSNQRDTLAAVNRKRNPVDSHAFGPALAKRHRQLADIQQWLVDRIHGAHLNVLRGSKASRTPSPMKISSDNMIATAKKPVKPSHGACTLALP